MARGQEAGGAQEERGKENLMDKLFKKTAAKPHIYYKILSQEELAARKEAKMGNEKKKSA